MGSGARSRCAKLPRQPHLEGFPGRLEAEGNEALTKALLPTLDFSASC